MEVGEDLIWRLLKIRIVLVAAGWWFRFKIHFKGRNDIMH